jgi:heat shock protein HslJ
MSILRSAGGVLLAIVIALTIAVATVAQSPATPDPGLEGTQWALRQLAVDGSLTEVPSDVAATLFLEAGQASGAAGCNTFSGGYVIDGSALTFGPMMSTLMICEDQTASIEASYLAAFPLVASYSLDGEALGLLDESGAVLLTYAAVTPQAIAGSWTVTSYNDDRNDMAPPITGSIMTAAFGADGTIEASAGCNTFVGPYAIDGDEIAIGPLATTLVACRSDDMQEQETRYLDILLASDRWSQDAGMLELIDTQGVGRQTTVVFSATDDAAYLGPWEVTGYDDGSGAVIPPVSGSTLTAVLRPDGTIEGDAGCNAFSGPYHASGTTMTIGPLATTRMACTSPAFDTQEQQLLTALQSVSTWEEDDGIVLRDTGGSTKVVLTRTPSE